MINVVPFKCASERLPELSCDYPRKGENGAAAAREAIKRLLKTQMKDTEVAAALDVSNAQAKVWLKRLVDEGVLEKQKKPAGYILKQSLFE